MLPYQVDLAALKKEAAGRRVDNEQNEGHNTVMEEVRERIKSDEIDKTVNVEKQNRHNRESSGYVERRSYLLPGVDAQELVNRYHGTGHIPFPNGVWSNKETVIANTNIGVAVDPKTGSETATNRFTIHYSNTGTHVVPSKRR